MEEDDDDDGISVYAIILFQITVLLTHHVFNLWILQGDQKASVHMMITVQKTRLNI
jgi:hypothetical protein